MHVWLIVCYKVLGGKFSDFSDVVMSLFFSDSRETQSRLTTASVLFGEHNRQTLKDFLCITLKRCIEHSITVYDNKSELFVVLKE